LTTHEAWCQRGRAGQPLWSAFGCCAGRPPSPVRLL